MGPRVVLDTNILVSSLGWRGAPHEIVSLCLDHRFQLLLSPALLEELQRVLLYPKFEFSIHEVFNYMALLTEAAELIQPDIHLVVIEDDPSDNRVLECALAGHADVIVSGDRHLLALEKFEAIPILRAQAFLDRFGGHAAP
jgi:uncharacterized protein